MTPPSIRSAGIGDASPLAALHLDVWDETYAGLLAQSVLDDRRKTPASVRAGRWRDRITQVPTWVAEEDGELVGFANVGLGRDKSGVLEVMALYVRARVYGQGVGHALLKTALGERAAYLWVLDGNARAIRFYERQGFGFDGRTKVEEEGLEHRMVRATGESPRVAPLRARA
ncbi:MAG: GNAT family N-acetyltransferase [Nocardioides sp.]|nr:GNAT family N-acetyltransferase [Nocardioides sp.]